MKVSFIFEKVGILLSLYIWMSETYKVQANIDRINRYGSMGGDIKDLVPMTIVRELGFKTGKSPNYITKISINEKSYGGDDGFDGLSIKLDKNEYFNEYKYQITKGLILNYVSFCTNKNRCVCGGTRQNDLELDRHQTGRRVFAISGRGSHSVNQLLLLTGIDNPLSQVKAVNATFILDVTPSSEKMIEYISVNAKMKESYLKSFWNIGLVELEYLVKMAANMDNSSLEIKYPYGLLMKEAFQSDLGKENITTYVIPEGHVGVKFALGEILRKPDDIPGHHWMFPTSGTWYSVVNTSDVSSLFGCYDLRPDLYAMLPPYEDYYLDLKKYKKKKFDFIYYDDEKNSGHADMSGKYILNYVLVIRAIFRFIPSLKANIVCF